MLTITIVLAVALGCVILIWGSTWRKLSGATQHAKQLAIENASLEQNIAASRARIEQLEQELERAKPYLDIDDAVEEARRIREEADRQRAEAEAAAGVLQRESRKEAKERIQRAEEQLKAAGAQARKIAEDAERRAEEVAGDAYKALKNADHLKRVVDALRNKIEGYGDRYIVPTYSLLDELADAYGFTDAGRELKAARQRVQLMVEHGSAAECDYVEKNRRETAIRFVVDAFNGKVDSILSRTKADNYGTLRQQIIDAFGLVNFNGQAFRQARITEEYLQGRLDELKWACAAVALRNQEREEQRRIKAQIREEERARREFERARKEAERDEAAVRKAMAKMQEQLARATESQRAEYEAKLAELSSRLAEAENKSQRALSMAQRTRSGHVYIVSNLGSFGDNVYKIGMTRRLEPIDRVRELGDASVPFGFDVHAMIYSDDAPQLERELHRRFLLNQVNKVNPRKEFFRVSISELKAVVDSLGMAASWTLAAEAAEYRESLAIEERIRTDVGARQQWLDHQSIVDPVVYEHAEDAAEV